ncbi:MAG: response regulator [Flavitalea sp.]
MSYSILVIDDNDDIRENIVEILQLAGYKADAASNGKSGVALALKQKPDLIVCDIMMPELDGYGVIHLLRTNPETQRTPVIFLTAKSERSDFRKGMELGADDYITKPFDDLELLKAVETRLKRVEFAAKNHKGVSNFFEELNAVSAGLPGSGLIEADSYEKKQVLYSENKTPRFLYYVNSGKVKTFRSHPDGKEYITNLYVSGDFIGYTSLIEDKFYDETAQVMEDAELLRI